MILRPLLEIERRFLVPDENAIPFSRSTSQQTIKQGYVAIDNVAKSAVRVRQEGDAFTLTVKTGAGIAKQEVNLSIDEQEFTDLWPLIRGNYLEKRRFVIPYEGHNIEVDVFRALLSGLVIAEVEFDTIEEADAFEPPGWFGQEVTHDVQFSNAWMSRHGNPLEADRDVENPL